MISIVCEGLFTPLPIHWQRGQAMAELLIIGTFVLIPLFFIIPAVAQLISLKQDAEVGARYAVWERTVWFRGESRGDLDGYDGPIASRSDSSIARQIDSRILSADTQAITSDPDPVYGLDAFLRLNHEVDGELEPLIAEDGSEGAVKHYTQQTASESAPDGMTGAVDDIVDTLGDISRFSLNTNGVFEATVSIPVSDLGGVFKLETVPMNDLIVTRSSVLFAEPWQAGGNDHAKWLISGLLLAQYLDNDFIETVQSIAAFGGISEELGTEYLDIGHVDIDPMPAYRLSQYGE